MRGIRLGLGVALLAAPGLAGPAVMTEQAALARAFPGLTPERRVVELTPEQVTLVEKASRSKLPSPKVTVFQAGEGAGSQGRAYLDSHIVRSMPETLLTVLAADGTVRMVLLLQFQDHPDYVPPEKWLKTLEGKSSEQQFPGRGVPRVTGSTMTVDAATAAVRRALAIDALLVRRPE
jgi:electron transport complex protein RnfG